MSLRMKTDVSLILYTTSKRCSDFCYMVGAPMIRPCFISLKTMTTILDFVWVTGVPAILVLFKKRVSYTRCQSGSEIRTSVNILRSGRTVNSAV